MRFQAYIYKGNGYVSLVVRDNQIPLHRKGSVLLRDQSIYPEDNGKLVWKNASYPESVMDVVRKGKGFIIAEADSLMMLDANINPSVITYLWETKNNVNTEEM